MPTDGQVGGGHQNRFLRTGYIKTRNYEIMKYHKFPNANANGGATKVDWTDPRCWNAGTPVRWNGGTDDTAPYGTVKPIIEDIKDEMGGELNMLVTTGSGGKHYHPLIQFFNVVTAGLITDGMLEKLRNVQDPKIARAIWKYLNVKYLKSSDSSESSELKDLIALIEKMVKDLKQSQPQ